MNDLEDRLRSGLHDLADTVPRSPHPRADLTERLARRRRWRAPAMVTAAAAAVVLAIVIVPVMTGGGSPRAGDVPTLPSPPPRSTAAEPTPESGGSGTEKDPWVLARVTEGGVEKDAVFWLTGDASSCMRWRAVDPANQASLPGPVCQPLPATWPAGPPDRPGMHVLQQGVLSSYIMRTGPLQNLMVFTTAPNIVKLDVRRGEGSLASVRELGRDDAGVTFYLVDFGPPPATPWGFGWTAWDARGNVVENVIT